MGDREFSPDVCHSSEADSCGNNQAERGDHIRPLDLSMKSSGMHRSDVKLCTGTLTEILGQAMGRPDSGARTSPSQRKLFPMWNADPVLRSPNRRKSKYSNKMRKTNAMKLQHCKQFSPELNVSGRTNPVMLPQTHSTSPAPMFQNNGPLISRADFNPHVTLLNKLLAQHLLSDKDNSQLANPSSQVMGNTNAERLHPGRNLSLDFNVSGSTNPVLLSQTQSSSPVSEADIDPRVALINMVLAQHLPKDRENSLQGNPQNPSSQVTEKANAEDFHHSRKMSPNLNVSGRANPVLPSQTQSSSPVSETDIDPHVVLINMVLAQHLLKDRENSLQGNPQNPSSQVTENANAERLQHRGDMSPNLNISGRVNPVLPSQSQSSSPVSNADNDPHVALINMVLAQHLPKHRENSLQGNPQNPSSKVTEKANAEELQCSGNMSPSLNISGTANPVLSPQSQSSSTVSNSDIDPHIALINMVLAQHLPRDRENSLQGNPQNPSSQVTEKANAEDFQHSRNMSPSLNISGRANPVLVSQSQNSSPVPEADIDPHVALINMVLAQHQPRHRANSLQGNSQNHPFQMTHSGSFFENQPFLGQNHLHDLSGMTTNIPAMPSINPIPSGSYVESSVSASSNLNRNSIYAAISRLHNLGFNTFFEYDQQFLLFRKAELDKINRNQRRQRIGNEEYSPTQNNSKGGDSESLQNSDTDGGDTRRDSRGQLRDSVYWRKRKRNNSSSRRSRQFRAVKEIENEIRLKYIKLLVETAYFYGMY